MQFMRSKTALRAVNPPAAPPFVIGSSSVFDPFELRGDDAPDRRGSVLTSASLVHVASLGLLVLLAVGAAPWWAFALLAFAWITATWAA